MIDFNTHLPGPDPTPCDRAALAYLEKLENLRKSCRALSELNEASYFIHLNNQHFYHDINTGQPIVRNKAELLLLMVSELVEANEGIRKNLMDSHIPHRHSEEVELADVVIRLLDYAGWRKLDLAGAVADKLAYNLTRKDHTDEARRGVHGKKY